MANFAEVFFKEFKAMFANTDEYILDQEKTNGFHREFNVIDFCYLKKTNEVKNYILYLKKGKTRIRLMYTIYPDNSFDINQFIEKGEKRKIKNYEKIMNKFIHTVENANENRLLFVTNEMREI